MQIACVVGWSNASTRCATLSLNSLTCIARILRLRLLLVYQTYRPSRTTFEFWVNGTGLRRSLQTAAGKVLIGRRHRRQINPILSENWKLRVIHARG